MRAVIYLPLLLCLLSLEVVMAIIRVKWSLAVKIMVECGSGVHWLQRLCILGCTGRRLGALLCLSAEIGVHGSRVRLI